MRHPRPCGDRAVPCPALGDALLCDHRAAEGLSWTHNAGSSPQRDTEVIALELQPVCGDFPPWLGGMTEAEAGLVVALVATT